MENSENTVLQRLQELLEEEARFLKAGNAAQVVALSGEKLELLREFEASVEHSLSSANRHHFDNWAKTIIRLAEENAEHFKAVSNGLEGVIQRMWALGGDTKVGAYSDTGADMSFQRSRGGYFRKL